MFNRLQRIGFQWVDGLKGLVSIVGFGKKKKERGTGRRRERKEGRGWEWDGETVGDCYTDRILFIICFASSVVRPGSYISLSSILRYEPVFMAITSSSSFSSGHSYTPRPIR